MTLEFNIIYTPGTVKYLSFFVWSLLKWSDCSFRLVSNGCLSAERRYLQALCRQDERLAFWTMPSKSSLPHGQVLNYLQAMSRADYFCFMDSDIFATGDFLAGLTANLASHTGVFSGMPIWVKEEEEVMPHAFRHMVGTFNRTDRGVCLGCTYVALYDNHVLTEVMQSTGIGFEEYRWHEIPALAQEFLISLDLRKDSYDTGKVLNLLLLSEGAELLYLDSPALCHIGGTSFQVHYDNQPQSIKGRIVNRLMNSKLGSPLKAVRQRRTYASYQKRYQDAPEAEFHLNARQRSQHRNPVRQYLLRLLNALFQDVPVPPPPVTGDEEIDGRLLEAKKKLMLLFEEYRDKLEPSVQ
jgi:hypothetical protein